MAEKDAKANGKALGIVEAVGLSSAILGADTALKAADVELIGYEFAKEKGQVAVKFCGNIGSVQAATSAARAVLEREGKYIAGLVIPRPEPEARPWMAKVDRAADGASPEAPSFSGSSSHDSATPLKEVEAEIEAPAETEDPDAQEKREPAGEICNICEDPACPRRKGDPHSDCIHAHDT